jgi:hypothetical protein
VKLLQKLMLPISFLNIVLCVISYEMISGKLALLNFLTACVCYLSYVSSKRINDER